MKAMSTVEQDMRRAWMRGLASRNWTRMQSDVSLSLVGAFDRGRGLFLPKGDSVVDIAAFHDRARELSMRAMREVESRYERASIRTGDEMLSAIYLLFFDEDDDVMRPIRRGVPSRIARRAAHFDVPIIVARNAQEILSQDREIRDLVRTVPRTSVLVAQDEVRRALNIGIADAAANDGRRVSVSDGSTQPAGSVRDSVHPLWEIREVMDRRTRGNPSGDFPEGSHWQVNGYINTIDEIIRQNCVPPCGRNCRASLVPVTERRAQGLGLIDSVGRINYAALRNYNQARQAYIDRGLYPDPGFR